MSSIFYLLDILNYCVIFYIRTAALFLQFRPSAHLKHRRQKLYNRYIQEDLCGKLKRKKSRRKTFSGIDSQPA